MPVPGQNQMNPQQAVPNPNQFFGQLPRPSVYPQRGMPVAVGFPVQAQQSLQRRFPITFGGLNVGWNQTHPEVIGASSQLKDKKINNFWVF